MNHYFTPNPAVEFSTQSGNFGHNAARGGTHRVRPAPCPCSRAPKEATQRRTPTSTEVLLQVKAVVCLR